QPLSGIVYACSNRAPAARIASVSLVHSHQGVRLVNNTLSAEAVPSTNDRATGGRFAKNNPGGPGNPFARQTAALRAYLIHHGTERDLQDILDILLLNAKGGHLPTIKFLFSYVLGKPKPVVEPDDLLDLQE